MRKTKHKEEKFKSTNKIKVKIMKKIIIHINNKMPALWYSKVTLVSVSMGLALCSPFRSVSGPFISPGLIVSLGRRKKKERNQKEK